MCLEAVIRKDSGNSRFSKEITADYNEDIMTTIFFAGLVVYIVATFVFLALAITGAAHFIDGDLFREMYYLTLRALLIPFEIFLY